MPGDIFAGWYSRGVAGPFLFAVFNSSFVSISNLRFVNSGSFHLVPQRVQHLFIANVEVLSPEHSANTDGIDVENCSYVHIRNATVAAGDDAIALKGRTQHVLIEKCNLRRKMM